MPDGCIEFTGLINVYGYGEVSVRSKAQRAHRACYELTRGPIPDGLDLDHLCRNRACVNPAHLEPVTRGENVRRGINANGAKTHCKNGHEFNEENTRLRRNGRGRDCRACQRDRNRATA